MGTSHGGKKQLLVRLIILIALIAGVTCAQVIWGIFDFVQQDRIEKVLRNAGVFAPLLHIVLMAAAVVVSPIPSIPLAIAGGMFFSPIVGAAYSLSGALGGATLSFLIARHLGIELVERIIGKPLTFYPKDSERLLMKIIFVSRLIPVISFDVVSYAAGLTKLSLGKFAAVTFLGMIPFTLVYSYFGSVLLIKTWVALAVGGVFVVAFLSFPALVRRYNLLNLQKYFDATD